MIASATAVAGMFPDEAAVEVRPGYDLRVDAERRSGRPSDAYRTTLGSTRGSLATVALLLACGVVSASLGMPPGMDLQRPEGRRLRYVMTAPAATSYTTDQDGAEDPVSRQLLSELPGLQLSACLTRAAAAYARLVPHDAQTQPPLAAIEFLLHWAGCPDPTATATVLYTTEDSTTEVVNGIRQLLAQPGVEEATHLGVARVPAENPPFRWRWGILAVERKVQLRRFPATDRPGGTLPLQFSLADGLSEPGVILLGADGRIKRQRVGHGGRWGLARIPLGHDRGRIWIEITAEGRSGPRVCALFPVEIGGAPPDVWEGTLPPDETSVRTRSQAEVLMLELVNADRKRFGLPSLGSDPHLAAIARRHSSDMAENGYFGHVSPSQGDLAARLGAGHYAVWWSGENISTSDSIYESQEALMRSPGHRANILAPQPTVVGIGIVRGAVASQRTWVVTQIFARPVPNLSARSFEKAMRARIGRRRASRGAIELGSDRDADDAARALAVRLRRNHLSHRALLAEANRILSAAGVGYHRLTILTYDVPDPDEIALPEEIGGPAAQAVGVGAARKTGEPLTTVVILVLEGTVEAASP